MVELTLGDKYGREINVERVEIKLSDSTTSIAGRILNPIEFLNKECDSITYPRFVIVIKDNEKYMLDKLEFKAIGDGEILRVSGVMIEHDLIKILFPIKKVIIEKSEIIKRKCDTLKFLCDEYQIGTEHQYRYTFTADDDTVSKLHKLQMCPADDIYRKIDKYQDVKKVELLPITDISYLLKSILNDLMVDCNENKCYIGVQNQDDKGEINFSHYGRC